MNDSISRVYTFCGIRFELSGSSLTSNWRELEDDDVLTDDYLAQMDTIECIILALWCENLLDTPGVRTAIETAIEVLGNN